MAQKMVKDSKVDIKIGVESASKDYLEASTFDLAVSATSTLVA